MKTFESTQEFGRVESSAIDVESLLLLQVMEQLAPVDKGQHEVEFLRRLEGKFQGDDEGVVDLSEHGTLGQGMRHLRTRDDMGLSDGLEGVDSAGVTLPTDPMRRRWEGLQAMNMLRSRGKGTTHMTCITLPKLPRPTTLRSSKSSMERARCRFSTNSTPILS